MFVSFLCHRLLDLLLQRYLVDAVPHALYVAVAALDVEHRHMEAVLVAMYQVPWLIDVNLFIFYATSSCYDICEGALGLVAESAPGAREQREA